MIRTTHVEHVSIDDVEPSATERGIDRRKLAGPLDTSNLAINRYVLEPGEQFAESLHAHMDQEEVFVVLKGEVTFELRDSGVTIGEDDVVRFAPGEFQLGKNDSEGRVVALALGAPCDSKDVRIARIPGIGEIACPECGRNDMRIPNEGIDLICPDCGAELAVE
jgi:mannose-6-phosphate isomerase-like protein (cupin superfamily)